VSSSELVHRFADLTALVLGDAMLDTYLEGTATRLCREGPVPVVRHTQAWHLPGGAANAAANLAALGARVRLLAIVGDDEAGSLLRGALGARGVDLMHVQAPAGARTHRKTRILADGQILVRFDEGDTDAALAAAEPGLARALEDLLPETDVVVVSDYGYGAVSSGVIDVLRRQREWWQGPLVVDAKDPRRFRGTRPTVLTPNQREAERAAGLSRDGAGDPLRLEETERIGRLLVAAVGADHAAVTVAADGVLVVEKGGSATHVPTRAVPHAGGIGAGDSFAAALALSLAAGASVVDAARVANVAASVAVRKLRTAVATAEELAAALDDGARPSRERGVAWDPRDLPTLAVRLEAARAAGATVVFTNGVFDILHAGHVEILRRAKELGDVLVVGINSDASARRLKGPTRPINGQRERAATLAALDHVDHVVVFDGDTPAEVIRALRPQVHVKGDDYTAETLPEADAVREVGGRIVILPRVGGLSTTGVIERITALGERRA
jgi:D-beta-D-heptose 7-phosphate kinase/D-beta-D-heptose 1-phosphate adenosyltransferase